MPFPSRPDPTARLRAALGEDASGYLPPVGAAGGGRDADEEEEQAESAAVPTRRSRRERAPGWTEAPRGLRGSHVWVTHPAVVALLAVAIVAAFVFGARVLAAQRASQSVPVAANGAGDRRPDAADPTNSSPPTGAPAGGGAPGTTVTVHVVGQVSDPGVVTLPAGSRVADAVTKAGGAGSKADLTAVNLARVLVDGEQILVPKPGQAASAGGGTGGGAGGSAGGAGGGSTAGAKVNLNTADLTALDSLPGVGPVLAQRILDWRSQHGRFTSVDELGEVSGIGAKVLANLTPLVTL